MKVKLLKVVLIPLLLSFLAVGCTGGNEVIEDLATESAEPIQPTESPTTPDPALSLCEDLSAIISTNFQADMPTTAAPFQDIVSGQTFEGCLSSLSMSGESFASLGDVITLTDSIMSTNGWLEDMNYGAGGAGGIMNGYRQNESICTVTNELKPADASLCSSDEPFTVCMDRLTADQKIYVVTLACADLSD